MTDGPTYEFSSTGSATQILTADEAEGLRERHRDAPEDHSDTLRVEAVAGRFRFAHDRSDVERGRGELLRPTQTARIRPFGRPMFAACERLPDEGNAELVVREANFDFVLDAASTIFSGGDRADTGRDVPVASDGYDAASGTFNIQSEPFGGAVNPFTLDAPGRASEVTVHLVLGDGWTDSESASLVVEMIGEPGRDDEPIVTRRSADDVDSYRATGAGGEVFATVDLPVANRVRIDVETSGVDQSSTTPKDVTVNAVVR